MKRAHARTAQDVFRQIQSAASMQQPDWIGSFLEHSQIKDAHGIADAVAAALKTYGRITVDGQKLRESERKSETIRTPKQVAIAGGNHEDCAVFAIALAMKLELFYQLTQNRGTLKLVINGVTVLPVAAKELP